MVDKDQAAFVKRQAAIKKAHADRKLAQKSKDNDGKKDGKK